MVTIRDVAKECGVSVATVSYVLNNGPRPVRADTRERVISAMQRLNYHPNAVARSLVRKRTRVIGILVGDEQSEIVTNSYYAGILAGVFAGARQRGYNITFFTADSTERGIEHHIRAQRPDALLMIAPRSGQDLPKRLRGVGIPLGVVGCGDAYQSVANVSLDVDNNIGMQVGMQYLWDLGHRKIVYAMGEPTQDSARGRCLVFEAFLRERGIEPGPDAIIGRSFHADTVYQATCQRLEQEPTPTAIFAGNDGIALAVLQAIQDSKYTVPDDIAVIGYDDWPVASYTNPALTTIRQPMHQIGEAIIIALADHLEEPTIGFKDSLIKIDPKLIVRGST
jgi:LacI family transcriptional regulator